MNRSFRGLLLLLTLVLAGCAPNFTGAYEGPVQTTVSCEGEDSQTSVDTVRFTLSEVDDVLVADAAGCIGVPAKVKETRATFVPYGCSYEYSPVQGESSIGGGTLTLNGSDLLVVLSGTVTKPGAACPFSTTGTLHHIVTSSSQ